MWVSRASRRGLVGHRRGDAVRLGRASGPLLRRKNEDGRSFTEALRPRNPPMSPRVTGRSLELTRPPQDFSAISPLSDRAPIAELTTRAAGGAGRTQLPKEALGRRAMPLLQENADLVAPATGQLAA